MTQRGSVVLADVGKRYVKYDDVPLLLTRAIKFRAKNRQTHLWALRHVSAEIAPGESFGVIGRNGSGKSTMLRMLAGVTAPTEGSVSVRGRVAPLISVGVGFHPELTGRENVYVNGTVLGMRRAEIDGLFDSIVAFSEIEQFIDTPVKFYSSGMFVRLGFAVAIASRPDVLLVDEVLAVGDIAFQTKCFDRMEEIRNEGTSIIVVSHALNAVRVLCERTLLLHNSEVKFLGRTDDAISRYHELLGVPMDEATGLGERGAPVRFLSHRLLNEDGVATSHVRFGEEVTFEATAEFSARVDQAVFGVHLINEAGQMVYVDFAKGSNLERAFEPGQQGRFSVRLPASLPTGSYKVRLTVGWDPDLAGTGKWIGLMMSFFVSGRPFVFGVADLGGRFAIDGGEPSATGLGGSDAPIGVPTSE